MLPHIRYINCLGLPPLSSPLLISSAPRDNVRGDGGCFMLQGTSSWNAVAHRHRPCDLPSVSAFLVKSWSQENHLMMKSSTVVGVHGNARHASSSSSSSNIMLIVLVSSCIFVER